MNRSVRLRYANWIVGMFTLTILAGLIVLTAIVYRRGQYFEPPAMYYLDISQSEVGDLYAGAEVWMLGQRIGSVSDLRYIGQTSRVRVELSIRASMADQMTDDVEIHLERKFGVGTPLLRIRRPSSPAGGRPGNPPTSLSGETLSPVEATLHPPFAAGRIATVSMTTTQTPAASSSGGLSDPSLDKSPLDPVLDATVVQNPPRRLRRFVGENDRLNKISDQVAKVAESVEAIRQKTVPTLDQIGRSADQVAQTNRGVEATVEDLRPRAAATLQSIDSASKSIQGDSHQIAINVNDAIGSVNDAVGTVNAVVDREVRQAVDAVRQSADATRQASVRAEAAAIRAGEAAEAVRQTSENTDREVTQTLADLRQTSAEVRRLTRETLGVVRIVRDEADDLPGTADRVNDAIGQTQDLVEQIQDSWLLRKRRRPTDSPRGVSPTSLRLSGVP